jgi:hypothetical protein
MSESAWQVCRIFVSSTFENMAAEREEVVKRVLPRVRTFGESIGVHVIGVDLRWGIQTSAQGGLHTVRRCLEAIDTCRPYFVSLGLRPESNSSRSPLRISTGRASASVGHANVPCSSRLYKIQKPD